MSLTKKVIAASVAVISSLALASTAQAYPAGSSPTMSVSNYANLLPGQSVNVVIARVHSGCSVTVGWDGFDTTTKSADSAGHASFSNVASPATGGRYSLVASFGAGCYSDQGNSITRSIVVGKQLKESAVIKTSSRSAVRLPNFTVTGKITWGVTAVSGLSVRVALHKGSSTYTKTVTTNSSGVYSATFGRGNGATITSGTWRANAIIDGDSTYAGQSIVTPNIVIN